MTGIVTTPDPKRLAKIKTLGKGSHSGISDGACVMEAAAYVAGRPWSDHPPCVCPVLGAFMRSWNDGLPDDERTQLLLPLIPKLLNTKGSKELEHRRSLMAADWLVREQTPAWLRLAGLTAQADTLAALPEITSMAQVPSLRGPLEVVRKDADAARAAAWAAARDAARDAAWDAAWDAARDAARAAARAAARDAARAAAWDAAWDAARAAARDAARAAAWDAARDAARAAAWDAAWDAARAAAWDAAWDAARDAARAAAWDAAWDAARAAAWDAAWDAARDAARAAAWDAARDAARDAAWDAAKAKLAPTRLALQASALKLVERMIAATDPAPDAQAESAAQ